MNAVTTTIMPHMNLEMPHKPDGGSAIMLQSDIASRRELHLPSNPVSISAGGWRKLRPGGISSSSLLLLIARWSLYVYVYVYLLENCERGGGWTWK
jgi:hypothetical protein